MSKPLPDFWTTWKGILTRLADISHQFTWGTYNASTKEFLAVLEADPAVPEEEKGNKISWTTMEDVKVCELCDENQGDYDPSDALLPFMPGHVDCRCWWEITAP